MKGRLGEITQTRDGEFILPFLTRDKAVLALWDDLHDKPVSADLKRWRQKRSLNANAYFHALVNQIAAKAGLSDEECKRNLVLEYGTLDRDADGKVSGAKIPASVDITKYYSYAKQYATMTEGEREYNCYLFYKPTHELDSAEMARLIDGTVREAKQLGIETLTANELAAMTAAWEEAR